MAKAKNGKTCWKSKKVETSALRWRKACILANQRITASTWTVGLKRGTPANNWILLKTHRKWLDSQSLDKALSKINLFNKPIGIFAWYYDPHWNAASLVIILVIESKIS